MPAILLVSTVGAFAIATRVSGTATLRALGIIGFLLEENGLPSAPVILGSVIGPLREGNFMTTVIKVDGKIPGFFDRAVSGTLGVITGLLRTIPVLPMAYRKAIVRPGARGLTAPPPPCAPRGPPGGARLTPRRELMLTIKRLALADAQTMIAAAQACADGMGVPTCIAVTDESGALIAFARMDGAKTIGVTIALDKAFTATGTRKPTHDLSPAVQPGAPAYGLITSHGGRMIVLPGGVPVVVDGVVIGGIGVSTGTPDQDLEVARAGVQAFMDSL